MGSLPVSMSSGPWGSELRSWTLTSPSPEQTRRIGRCLGEALTGGEIIALRGDLGAGKTCLTQGLAAGLGVPEGEAVASPSYTLLNPYHGRVPLYHFDLYRLMGEEDLEDLGFFEYLGGDGVTVVEWADRIEGWTSDRLDVHLDYAGEGQRCITLQADDAYHCALLKRFEDRWTEGGDI